MIMVGAMAAALWGIGIAMKAPYSVRWNMMGVLMVGVMMIHVILPAGHPLRMATGGDARLWGLLIAFGFIIWGYRKVLGGLRARVVRNETPVQKSDSFSPKASSTSSNTARAAG